MGASGSDAERSRPERGEEQVVRAGDGDAGTSSLVDAATAESIPLFGLLPRGPFDALLPKLRLRRMRTGDTIVEEGRHGDTLFAIASGTVQVVRGAPEGAPVVVAEMQQGEFFGEISLLARCPRLATVRAISDGVLLELGQSELEEIHDEHVHRIVERIQRERLVENVLRASPILADLPRDKQRLLGEVFKIEAHEHGKMLLEQGARGTGFFVLLRGRCEVFHRKADGREEHYPAMTEGDVFGEVSLLQGTPVTACVRTAGPSIVLMLPSTWFESVLLEHAPARKALYDLAWTRLQRTHTLVQTRVDRGLV